MAGRSRHTTPLPASARRPTVAILADAEGFRKLGQAAKTIPELRQANRCIREVEEQVRGESQEPCKRHRVRLRPALSCKPPVEILQPIDRNQLWLKLRANSHRGEIADHSLKL
jgi:hypothetical protein